MGTTGIEQDIFAFLVLFYFSAMFCSLVFTTFFLALAKKFIRKTKIFNFIVYFDYSYKSIADKEIEGRAEEILEALQSLKNPFEISKTIKSLGLLVNVLEIINSPITILWFYPITILAALFFLLSTFLVSILSVICPLIFVIWCIINFLIFFYLFGGRIEKASS